MEFFSSTHANKTLWDPFWVCFGGYEEYPYTGIRILEDGWSQKDLMQDEKLVLPIVSFSFLISTPSKMTKQSDMAKILKSEEFYPIL